MPPPPPHPQERGPPAQTVAVDGEAKLRTVRILSQQPGPQTSASRELCMKNWVTKQEFKTCGIRDVCDTGHMKDMGERVEVSEGQSCRGRGWGAEMNRLVLDSDKLEVKSRCCQPLAV